MEKLFNWQHLKAEMQSRAVITDWRGNGVKESSNPPHPYLLYLKKRINLNNQL